MSIRDEAVSHFAETHLSPGPELVCVLVAPGLDTSPLSELLRSQGMRVEQPGSHPELVQAAPSASSFRAINDEILSAFGGSWLDPPLLPARWQHSAELAELRHRARVYVKSHLESSAFLTWIDPRASLTLPFWQLAIPRLRCLVYLGDPLSATRRLAAEHGVSSEGAIELWLRYLLASLESAAEVPNLLLLEEDLKSDGGQRLAHFFGLPEFEAQVNSPPANQAGDRMSNANEPSIEEILDDPDLPFTARALYLSLRLQADLARPSDLPGRDRQIGSALLTLARSALSPSVTAESAPASSASQFEQERLQSVNQALLQRESRLREMLLDAHEQLLERDDELQDLVDKLDEQTQWSRRSNQEVARRDEINREMMERLEEQAAWARRSNDEVLRRDGIIEELNSALQEQRRFVAEQAEEVSRRDTLAAELQEQLTTVASERDGLAADRWDREERLNSLETVLAQSHVDHQAQLAQTRDEHEVLRAERDELATDCATQRRLAETIRADLARAVAEIDRMTATRVWRLGRSFWSVRSWPRRLFGGGAED